MIPVILTLVLACLAQAQSIGPWASLRDAPSWWLNLHGAALGVQLPPIPSVPFSGPTVSFSPQGAKILQNITGKTIAGVGVHDLVICSPTGNPIPAGTIYQLASAHGIEPISPVLADSLFRATVARNWRNTLLTAGTAASIGIPVLGQSGIISMSNPWVVALLGGHVMFDAIEGQIRSRIPDPGPVLRLLLDPNGIVNFNGACREATMITRYGKNVVSGVFALPTQ